MERQDFAARFFAAARENNVELFYGLVENITRLSAIQMFARLNDSTFFRFPPVLEILRTLSVVELRAFIDQACIKRNDLPLSALIKLVGRDLPQDHVDCFYRSLLCKESLSRPEISPTRLDRQHQHVESLMKIARYPVGAALAKCAEIGDAFLVRYMRRWPLDRVAVHTALKRRLELRGTAHHAQTVKFLEANITFLLTHSERPAWTEIPNLISNIDIGDTAIWIFVAVVERHYNLADVESECSPDDYAYLASTFFPRAASHSLLEKKIMQLLGSDDIAEFRLPETLERGAEGETCFILNVRYSSVAAVRLFELAASSDCMLVLDYLLNLPTLPKLLTDAVYQYVLDGERRFIKRCIMKLIGQRGLCNEFADFWIGQYLVPASPVWTMEFPRLGSREWTVVLPMQLDEASDPRRLLPGFTAVFNRRISAPITGDQAFVRTCAQQMPVVHPNDVTSAIGRGVVGSNLATHKNGFKTASILTMLAADECLFLEFTKRPNCDRFYFQIKFGTTRNYRLHLLAYTCNQCSIFTRFRDGVVLSKITAEKTEETIASLMRPSDAFGSGNVFVVAVSLGSIGLYRAAHGNPARRCGTLAFDGFSCITRFPIDVSAATHTGTNLQIWSNVACVDSFYGAHHAQLCGTSNE